MHTPDPSQRSGQEPSAGAISDGVVAALVAAGVAGDRRAWEPLFDELAPRLLDFFQRSLQDPVHAERHVEAAFLELHRSRHTFRRAQPVRPWVFGIAVRARVDGRSGLDRAKGSADGRRAAGGARREGARDRQVRQALEELTGLERMAIHLHRFERMNFEEIAGVLGWTEEAVRCQVLHTYRALRERLWMVSDDGEGT